MVTNVLEKIKKFLLVLGGIAEADVYIRRVESPFKPDKKMAMQRSTLRKLRGTIESSDKTKNSSRSSGTSSIEIPAKKVME
jgi:hypothetical protein